LSRLQTEIAPSTTKVEYIALSMYDLLPMGAFLKEIGQKLQSSYEENHDFKLSLGKTIMGVFV